MWWHILRLGLAQDVQFFYMHSHLSALQNCALILSTKFQFIFTFKYALHNLVIELCSEIEKSQNHLNGYLLKSRTVCSY